MTTKHIYIDVWNPMENRVDVVQGEVSARYVVAHIHNSGVPLNLDGASVQVYGTKPDGTGILNECQVIDATRGQVSVPMSQQMSIAPGEYQEAGLQIVRDGKILKVLGLSIVVHPAYDYDEDVSEDELSALQEAIYRSNYAASRVPSIGENGNWYLGDEDTGESSRGKDGVRGRGLLKVSTAPTEESSTVDGYAYKYKFKLSTVLDESGASEVLVGDIVKYSYYEYGVGYVGASYAFAYTRTSIRGTAGTSVTVSSVSESAEDGGSNVVNFSDGKSLTVKNGTQGSPGAPGEDGYTPVRGKDYWTPDDVTAMESDISEKVTTAVAGKAQLKPEFAQSEEWLNENGNTSRMYVLPDGFIYAFIKTTTTTEGESVPNFKNVMDDPNASIKTGVRYSQSGAASGTQWKSETGDTSIIIPMTSVKPTIRVRGAGNNAKYNNYIYVSYDGKELFPITPEYTRTVADNGDITITVNTTLSTPKYATFAVASGFNADELIVTVNEEITYTTTEGGTVTTEQWVNTGLAFVPADYESRIIAVENKAEENADKISELENEMSKPKPTGIVTMFISPNGNDANGGFTASTPKKTVKACMAAGATRISAKRGIYNEQITLSNIDTLEIFPTDNDYTFDANVKRYPPIVFDTSHTIPVSSLSAYNSIKKVAYAETNAALTYVFTNGLYDRVYSTTHGYHAVLWAITGNIKNDFKLKPMATIAEVEATANSFTWVDNVIYLNADLTNVIEIRVPTIYDNAITVFTANKVKLTDVEIRFAGRYNILIENCPDVEMDNCSVKYSSNGSGFDMKNANGTLKNCYASRVHDGYGIGDYGHTIFVDCVAEWCYDDGMSHHRGCTGTVIGGRYEGNVKAGNCPAHGANVNIYGGLYKDNGLWGIAYWYENTYNPCTGMVQGAVMVGNPKGLVVDAGSSVTALNCHYVGNTVDKDITGTLVEY